MNGVFEEDSDSTSDILGKKFAARCNLDPCDYVRVGRVGFAGTDMAVVALDVLSSEPTEESTDAYNGDGEVVTSLMCGTVLLTPGAARYIAAHLINLADECDGTFTSLITDFKADGGDLDAV